MQTLDTKTKTTLEKAAVRLARAAGAYISTAYTEPPTVEFKTAFPGGADNSNPVSKTDRAVETLIRDELKREFPDHAIIGEEMPPASAGSAEFTWVIDPIDGTTNFINGLPLFCSSIGVLYRGAPLVGAIWCTATHALHPGVYHAQADGPLQLDGLPFTRRTAGSWRGVAAEPGYRPAYGKLWDTRTFGSSTLEFALVAAGILRLAYCSRPSLWDVAAGMTLLQAAGCHAMTVRDGQWQPLTEFDPNKTETTASLSRWNQPVLIGEREALDQALRHTPSPTGL